MSKCNTLKYGKNYICYTDATLWNMLNNETKQTINIKAFRELLCYGMDQHVLVLTARIAG